MTTDKLLTIAVVEQLITEMWEWPTTHLLAGTNVSISISSIPLSERYDPSIHLPELDYRTKQDIATARRESLSKLPRNRKKMRF